MKRKDDEKLMGPMFPRLHVNDTDKGGPRAPPRNKMALYEQLSIPSQRFNPGVLPLNPSKSTNLVPSVSSSQGCGVERNSPFPAHVPHSVLTHGTEIFYSHQPDGGNLSTPVVRVEPRKKVGDEDDFRVPVFVQSRVDQYHNKTQNSIDREKHASFKPTYSGRPMKIQHVGPSGQNLKQDARNQSEENMQVCISSRDQSVRPLADLPTRNKITSPEEEAHASQNQQYQSHPVANFSRLHEINVCPPQEPSNGLQRNDSGCNDDVPQQIGKNENGNDIQQRSNSGSVEDHGSPNEPEFNSESHEDRTCRSVQLRNGDKGNDISEISMLDCISELDVSPDDVVRIIGQKHFWKARRAIVNQQRVFAVQVFELHRLIKVQQLIAKSPHLLLEDSTYPGKPSCKDSPADKLPSESVVIPHVHAAAKCKDGADKPNHKMEGTAENAVGKTSFSSVTNGSQPSNYWPCSGNPTIASVSGDGKMDPWSVHNSPGHQWLVPVMSPSEGLIYKPYAMPGFMGSACGGCNPFGPIPLPGNYMNPAYGVPTSHPHHGVGFLPCAPPVGHGYFPPYSIPVMNPAMSSSAVEQMNYFAGSGSQVQATQLSGGGANFNVQHQSPCNVPNQKSEAVPKMRKFKPSKDTELQGSTASSPSERAQGAIATQATEGRDPLPLLPTALAVPDGAPLPQETDQPTRVIKVVPRNARSATESVARIFQSIQEERKQHDSI